MLPGFQSTVGARCWRTGGVDRLTFCNQAQEAIHGTARRQGSHRHRRGTGHRTRGGAAAGRAKAPRSSSTTSVPRSQGEGGRRAPGRRGGRRSSRRAAATAAVNGDDISSWEGGKNAGRPGRRHLRPASTSWSTTPGSCGTRCRFNMEESDWDDVIRVHLKGHFAPTHHAAVYWRNRAKAGEDGHAAASSTPPRRPASTATPARPTTAAAKAGIAALTWVLARELGRYGVTVNAIAPRARTRMTENLFGEMAKKDEGGFDAWDPQEHRQPGRLPGAPRVGRHQRPDLRRLRRQHLRHERLPAGGPGDPRLGMDPAGTDRGQG